VSGFFSEFLTRIGLRDKKRETDKIPEKTKPANHHIPEVAQIKEPANHVPFTQPKDRQIRVFISSTFSDMHDERDILIKKIFPQLRKLCEERAVTWTEVDLRWGITREESDEGKVLPLCLEEIHRCRPYFVGLLGERYGRLPKSISADLLESQPWLKEHLEHSVTELEIIHGVFHEEQMHKHAYFYFRDPKYLESVPEGKRQYFMSDEASGKLVKLKEKIRDARDKEICVLREGYVNPEQLSEWILEDFTALIDRLYPKDKIPDPLDQEAMRHEAYAKSRRLAFVGRSDLLRQMDEHAGSAGAKPLILTGESGCGKSALLAEWAARWHDKNPDDLIIQHYTGSTPESADWQGLVRRILSELKRAYNITDELPMQPDTLRTAMQDWLVKAAGSRRVVIVLDALNQLSGEDASARQLGWLPFALPPNVRLIVSSLPGESLDALRKRNWKELVVPLFGRDDIAPAAKAYFDIYSKRLPNEILAKIEDTAAAANPLYLRAVLDELRQFGLRKELENKDFRKKLEEEAFDYLKASDPPTLFDLILTRWDEDFGKDGEYPDHVRRSLCLIACSRFGLSETELLDLLGKKNADGKYEPLPRRPWIPFYLAAENALAQRAGLLTFGHEYLRAAVERRYLSDGAAARNFRLQLTDYFGRIPELTNRKLDELPVLLRDTGQWESLKDMLADLPIFERMRGHKRWKWELHGFWLAIGGRYDPVEVYRHSLTEAEMTFSAERLPYFLNGMALFHKDAGRYEGAEQLFRRALEANESVFGKVHPSTLICLDNLAGLLYSKGDYKGAEPLHHRALEACERMLGKEHPDTLACVNNLATLLARKGDIAGAESLIRRTVELCERVLGKDHPNTLTSVFNLGELLNSNGDYEGAEQLFRRALETRERVLGKDHPDTLHSVNGLAVLLKSKGDYKSAEPLYQRTLEAFERVLGKEHPDVATSMYNIASFYEFQGNYVKAEQISRRALAIREKALGPDHLEVAHSLDSIAKLCFLQGKYIEVETLSKQALEIKENVLGREHPNVATSISNMALFYGAQGNYEKAELLYRRVLSIEEKALGLEHSDVAATLNNLAGLYNSIGKYTNAEPLLKRALAIKEKVLRPEHPDIATALNNLALLYKLQGKNADAEPLYRRSLAIREKVLGPEHPEVGTLMINLAALYRSQGKYADSELLYNRALPILEKSLGPEHPNVAASMYSLSGLYYMQGKYVKAEQFCRRAVEIIEKVLGPDHPNVNKFKNSLKTCEEAIKEREEKDKKTLEVSKLARLLMSKGDYNAAEPLLRSALEDYERVFGKEHPETLTGVNNLAMLLKSKGDYEGAEPLYRRALEGMCKVSCNMGSPHPHLTSAVDNYTVCLRKMGRSAEDIQGDLETLGRRFGFNLTGAGGQTEPSPKLLALMEQLMRDPLKFQDIAAKLQHEDPALFMELLEWIHNQQQK
jgi:tetratricopeptide (TPR) repeat protein